MRLLLILIGACVVASGCDKEQVQTQADKDAVIWKSLCETERADKEKLQSALNFERAANAEWPQKYQTLQAQIAQLKSQMLSDKAAAAQEIARLKTDLEGAKGAAVALAVRISSDGNSAPATASVNSPNVNAPVPTPTTTGIAEAEKAVADLQARLNELQGKAGLARNKVTSLQNATVDMRIPPPDGHAGDPFNHPTKKDGNFRSDLDKQGAILKAKGELVPIEIELRKTQDDLAKAKLALAKIRSAQ